MASNESSFAIPSQYLPPNTPSAAVDYEDDTPESSIALPNFGDATLLKDTKIPWGEEMSMFVPPFQQARKGKTVFKERVKKTGHTPIRKAEKLVKVASPAKAGKTSRQRSKSPRKRTMRNIDIIEDNDSDFMNYKKLNRDTGVQLQVETQNTGRGEETTQTESARKARRSRHQREEPLNPLPPILDNSESAPSSDLAPIHAAVDMFSPAVVTQTSVVRGKERKRSQPKASIEVAHDRKSLDTKHRDTSDLSAKPESARASTQLEQVAVLSTTEHRTPQLPFSPHPVHSRVHTPPVAAFFVPPPANLPMDETMPLPPPTPAAVRQEHRQSTAPAESSDDASFGGLMEKLKMYKERIGVVDGDAASSASSSTDSSSPEPAASPHEVETAALPVPQASDPVPLREIHAQPATVIQQSYPGQSLLEKLEAAARQTVRGVLPPSPAQPFLPPSPPAVQDPLPVARIAPEPPAPTNARKRVSSNDDKLSARPMKKPRQAKAGNKENVPAKPAPRKSPRKSPAKSRKRVVTKPPVLVETKPEPIHRAQTERKPERKVVTSANNVPRQPLERIKVLEEKKQALVESIQHRIPSTSFAPVLPPAVIEKHKQTFASTRAVWEQLATAAAAAAPVPPKPKKSNYHPAPNWTALHAQEDQRKARALAKQAQAHKPLPSQPFTSATELRAKEREEFERLIREKEELLSQLKEEKRLQQEMQEKEEVERLRRELDVKARERVHEVPEWMRKRKEELKASTIFLARGGPDLQMRDYTPPSAQHPLLHHPTSRQLESGNLAPKRRSNESTTLLTTGHGGHTNLACGTENYTAAQMWLSATLMHLGGGCA
ncbi:hypothetical protein DACRYDRAFT_102794 [Dacryopinax primogenitus]|uniref:TPX2 C-terminal domain-containing protein n=1 Tax=Dacryopinax primogenitus (strain DJM 731) TaxID=1858805 RepID=M5FU36_DACPD|nr:uncharacterized protein DACRYDRAFT_102794 [Dacryopinax primogenitus]EJT96736.1 hypothetical protein DACRYDRAFT_102794 [Dacryopinax primogenitus]